MSPNSTFLNIIRQVKHCGTSKSLIFTSEYHTDWQRSLRVPFCPVFNDTLHIFQNLPSSLTLRHFLALALSEDPLDGVQLRGTSTDASSVPIACIHFLLPHTQMSKNERRSLLRGSGNFVIENPYWLRKCKSYDTLPCVSNIQHSECQTHCMNTHS